MLVNRGGNQNPVTGGEVMTLVWIALASVITSPPVTGLALPPRLTSTSACRS